jgi:hypothetical protein
LLPEVLDLTEQANEALAEGPDGFEEWGRLQAEIADLIEQAYLLAGGDPRGSTPTTTPEVDDGAEASEDTADDGEDSPDDG